MNESKAMLELADKLEVCSRDGTSLPLGAHELSMCVAALRSSAPQEDGRALEREAVAKIIYDAFPFDGTLSHAVKPVWIPGGNSIRQDDARRAADSICALSAPPSVALEAAGRETIPLADHDEIGRMVLDQPWEVQKALVTIAAHCLVITDECPTGKVADLAGCISHCCMDLAASLTRPQPGGAVAGTERGEGQ